MAYADRNTSGSRTVSIVIVSIIVGLFLFGLINGFTAKYIKKAAEKLNTFDVVEPPPPPPDKPPPPPPEQPQLQTPPVVSPPPIVRVQAPPPPVITVITPPPSAPVVVRAAAPAPAPVAAPTVSKAAGPKGNPADWITNDDYPSDALSAEASGTTRIRWDIGTNGRVENCTVTSSSGNSSLDRAACSALTRRGRYSPALDQSGQPIRVVGQTRNVRWQMPQ